MKKTIRLLKVQDKPQLHLGLNRSKLAFACGIDMNV